MSADLLNDKDREQLVQTLIQLFEPLGGANQFVIVGGNTVTGSILSLYMKPCGQRELSVQQLRRLLEIVADQMEPDSVVLRLDHEP